ncbi:MAG: hypothetical protein LC131_03590 [Anaerolineae bacterium]|nr:hypothetical protein [Anaerolineae bacterium]
MSASPGAISAPADARHGTQVLYRWAEWLRQHGFPRAARVAIFRKEDERLVVHEYASSCVILKIGPTRPKLQEFREWKQPFVDVAAKLCAKGWHLGAEPGVAIGKTVVTMFATWQQAKPPVVTPYAVQFQVTKPTPVREVSHAN